MRAVGVTIICTDSTKFFKFVSILILTIKLTKLVIST